MENSILPTGRLLPFLPAHPRKGARRMSVYQPVLTPMTGALWKKYLTEIKCRGWSGSENSMMCRVIASKRDEEILQEIPGLQMLCS